MVYDLARIPTPTGGWNVYAASYAGVQLSTDRGLSWFRAGTGMEAGSTWKLAASGTTLFVGTLWKGMYICNGLDPVWRPMGIDPVSKNGYTLGLATTPRYLLAGLNTGTFRTWRRPLDSFVTDVEESPSPASPVITSLHPNPGNAIVSMDLTLRQPGCVSVVVKDQCGRDLGVMFDDWLPVGCNVVTWSVASLPSGMYHCVLRTEQGVATRPIQVLHR